MSTVCNMCGKYERECQCVRYCMICKADTDIRLCTDGCYYCLDCREACDLTPDE